MYDFNKKILEYIINYTIEIILYNGIIEYEQPVEQCNIRILFDTNFGSVGGKQNEKTWILV